MDGYKEARLVLISAPAGYGKTSLIAQWLKKKSSLSSWLSLDLKDNDPARFLRYLISSFRTVIPKFGKTMEGILSAKKMPPPDLLADLFISELSELRNHHILVLDEYQMIQSEDIHSMLARVLDNLPDVFQLIVITRTDPPWPLTRWRVRRWMQELRAEDISFTLEETQILLHPFHLAKETLNALYKRTEGWVAAMQLVQLSLAEAEDPEHLARKFSDQDHMIMVYLVDEVISFQSPEVLEFLAITSILDRFCAPLCDALLKDKHGSQPGRELLDILEKKNLFLVPLDNEHIWYRYHNLFRINLRHVLKKHLVPERILELHRCAGEWFHGEGLVEEALQHLLAADEITDAAALVEENLHAIIDQDLSRRTLNFWLSMFSKAQQEQYPALLIAQAYWKVFHWDLTGIKSLLDKAENLLEDKNLVISEERRKKLLGDIDVQRGFFLYWQGNVEAALQHAWRAMGNVPKDHHYAYGLAVMYMAQSHVVINGDRQKIQKMLSDLLSEDCAAGSANAGPILQAQTAIHLSSGNIKAVEDTVKKMLTFHDSMHLPDYWYGNTQYFLGIVAYERNDLERAGLYFERVKEMRYRMSTRTYHDSLLGLALVHRAKGNFDEAKNYAAVARQFAIEMNDPYSMRLSDSFEMRLAMFSAEIIDAPADSLPIVDSYFVWMEIASLTHAEYLVFRATSETGDFVLGEVLKALHQVERCHNIRQFIQFLAVKAMALYVCGRLAEALDVIATIMQMAEPLGYVRTFIDRGPLMAKLLRILSAKKPHDHYLQRLLSAFQNKTISYNKKKELNQTQYGASTEQLEDNLSFAGLSNREIDVLLLLDERLTNKEISERLHISTETVKTHTGSIFRKLGINKRRQAIFHARKLGILPQK